MKAFAELLDRLAFTPGRNGKLRLLADYFAAEPDPARGYALAALTGNLVFATAKPAQIRALVESRVDPVLFRWSYDYVGDLAETVALIWPERPGANQPARPEPLSPLRSRSGFAPAKPGRRGEGPPPELPEVVERLQGALRGQVPALIEGWLDALDATGRWALLKLITGGLRIGISARLAKTALARISPVELAEIEEVWHGLQPPYVPLFAWLEGRGPRPEIDLGAAFRPLMLAQPLDEAELKKLVPNDYCAEWKWDGIRVQLAAGRGRPRLFSRSGDEIGRAFPDLLDALDLGAVLDGELLVLRGGEVAPFNDLQQRLNRKTVTAKLMEEFPAHLRLYDILFEGGEDLRGLPFTARRGRLEAWYRRRRPPRMDLSPLLPFGDWDELRDLRERAAAEAPGRAIEGVMLKRADSAYVAGRPKGPWFKWKRDARLLDAVLMYAQRGHGKRSSFYSDYTFGLWRDGEEGAELVPVGKAYFGFTDEELRRLDKWVRDNTVERYGPVRAVAPGLVLEVAFDAVQPSKRHKSGLAMRFPRISRIRWDKPAAEADRLETLAGLVEG